MTDQTVADVLNGAADHIGRYGHHKFEGFASTTTMESAACVHGCITAQSQVTSWVRDKARDALRDHLGIYNLSEWNDAPERTATEVVEALRAAAIIAAAREADVTEVRPELAAGVAVTA